MRCAAAIAAMPPTPMIGAVLPSFVRNLHRRQCQRQRWSATRAALRQLELACSERATVVFVAITPSSAGDVRHMYETIDARLSCERGRRRIPSAREPGRGFGPTSPRMQRPDRLNVNSCAPGTGRAHQLHASASRRTGRTDQPTQFSTMKRAIGLPAMPPGSRAPTHKDGGVAFLLCACRERGAVYMGLCCSAARKPGTPCVTPARRSEAGLSSSDRRGHVPSHTRGTSFILGRRAARDGQLASNALRARHRLCLLQTVHLRRVRRCNVTGEMVGNRRQRFETLRRTHALLHRCVDASARRRGTHRSINRGPIDTG
jgi:hypothetical protein